MGQEPDGLRARDVLQLCQQSLRLQRQDFDPAAYFRNSSRLSHVNGVVHSLMPYVGAFEMILTNRMVRIAAGEGQAYGSESRQ